MIYLIKDNKVIETFDNVISWGINFVEFNNDGFRCKRYCDEDEYFTDELLEEENLETSEE